MANPPETVLASLNRGLHVAMTDNLSVIAMGEDIKDPYGGAFKVTRGLSESFPDRVISTPISEAGFIGVATGLALRGYRPVVEIMFGDFATLVMDQVINHISKICSMYPGVSELPVIIRTPMGGRRGYGPTHSQTLEKYFFGIPNFSVIAPCHFVDGAGELLYRCILQQNQPALFVENKLQYLLPIVDTSRSAEFEIKSIGESTFPIYQVQVKDAPPPQATIMTYGYMAELAQRAMLELAYQKEIFTNLLVFTQLSPLVLPGDVESIIATGDILILEEGTRRWGWGAEIAARIAEEFPSRQRKLKRLAAEDVILPASPALEEKVVPQVKDIIAAIITMRGS